MSKKVITNKYSKISLILPIQDISIMVDPDADGAVVISFKNLIPDSSDSNKNKFLMNDFNVQYGSAVYNFDIDVTKKLAIFLVIKHDTSISDEAFVPRIEKYFATHYGWRTLFGISKDKFEYKILQTKVEIYMTKRISILNFQS